ncbi:MAG: helix-turn-helix domain-containing protein [Paracoccaceae bacterium]
MTDWYSEEAATFGDRLAAAREASGLSQKGLARNLGVKTALLRAWEEDRSEPRASRLSILSGMLGVSLSWLMTGTGEGPTEEVEPVEEASEDIELVAELRALSAQAAELSRRIAMLEKRLRARA